MATYDRGRHILPSVRSVLDQEFSDFELLVVGDACTDDTGDVLAPLLSDRLRWINLAERTGSQSGPNNAGIEAARGRWIAYLGHDDIWTRDHLSALADVLGRGDVDIAVSGAIYHMPPGVDAAQVTGLFDDGSAARRHFFPPSSLGHVRTLTHSIGVWRMPFDIRLPVDSDLQLRAADAGARFRSTGRITVHKFAAGHRYLSYLEQESWEQEAMLARSREPGFDRQVAETVEMARRSHGYMAVGHPVGGLYEIGQLARENAARKGLRGATATALVKRALVPPTGADHALDWQRPGPDGQRRVGPNPNPKILLPFLGDGDVAVQTILSHPRREALASLDARVDGRAVLNRLGEPVRLGDAWQAVATLVLPLRPDRATILQLRLDGNQRAGAPGTGIALGAIAVDPSPAAFDGATVAEELAAEQVKAAGRTIAALQSSRSWRFTAPLRRLEWLARKVAGRARRMIARRR